MAKLNPDQMRTRERFETLIRLIAPGLNLVLATGERLSRAWSVQVIADNRPGGGGNIGTEQCARAPADGYTICMFSIAQNLTLVS